ncbi:hypothetical protein L486_05579 [Kwoniella mangroviensis CBS 10435]|uniref:Uncharacterized protein n=2 Tax=Kwoniella mangrovensis TaxID=463800 RepID=A0A1B9IMB5_9TREE|nr:hypothetical protein L486_05579 [Kwoniella mangroviensis CBS 10435]OCF75298.1 hypothetical protein I204_04151 [Kwoniella mangroviensis CBS 8886]
MPFCLDDHGREQLERGKETLATARDMRAIHTLTVREMLTVLRSETVDYEEVRKRGPALERSLTPDAWLEDGMKFVRRTIRELTLIASTEIQPDQQYSSKPSSNSKPTKFRASTKFTGDSPVFTLIYPSDTVDSGAMSPQDVEL